MAVFAARRALQDAGVDAARPRLRDRRDDERRTRSRPTARRCVAHALGADARRRVRHRRRLHRLPRRARAGRRADRGRPRGARPADRRREADPHHRLRRQEDRDAVRRRRGRGRARPDRRPAPASARSTCAPTAASGDTIMATPRGPVHPHGRHLDVQDRRQAPVASRRSTPSRAAGLELDDIDLFVYHQANSRILKAVGERLELDPAKVADYIAQLGNTCAASIPLTLSLSREDGRLRPGHKVLRRPRSARASPGAPA